MLSAYMNILVPIKITSIAVRPKDITAKDWIFAKWMKIKLQHYIIFIL